MSSYNVTFDYEKKVQLNYCECGEVFTERHTKCRYNENPAASNESAHVKPTKTMKMRCDFCDEVFSDSKSRADHVENHYSNDTEKCPTCKLPVPGNELKVHFQSHLKRFTCSMCNEGFERKGGLWEHKKRHEGKEMNQCGLCSERFFKKIDLKLHNKEVHEKKSLEQCKWCDKKFLDRKKLDAHLRQHSSKKPYKCNECSAFFNSKSAIKSHAKKKHMEIIRSGSFFFTEVETYISNENERICPICSKEFPTIQGKNIHFTKMHSNVSELLE